MPFHFYLFKMKKHYLNFLLIMISFNLYPQINFYFGPFSTSFPDPLAHIQERRMARVEQEITTQAAIIAGALGPLAGKVKDYDVNLSTSGTVYSAIANRFFSTCITSIGVQEISSGIPVLSQFNVVNTARTAVRLASLHSVRRDHTTLMLPTNAMTDGERRLMSLKSIRLALKITLND